MNRHYYSYNNRKSISHTRKSVLSEGYDREELFEDVIWRVDSDIDLDGIAEFVRTLGLEGWDKVGLYDISGIEKYNDIEFTIRLTNRNKSDQNRIIFPSNQEADAIAGHILDKISPGVWEVLDKYFTTAEYTEEALEDAWYGGCVSWEYITSPYPTPIIEFHVETPGYIESKLQRYNKTV